MINGTNSDVYRAVQNLREYGVKDGGLPRGSHQLYNTALKAWSQGNTPENEYDWRAMSLIHGAVLAHRGQWYEAITVFNDNPKWASSPPAAHRDCRALAAFMAMGEAVARWRTNAGKGHAYDAACRAFRYFDLLGDNQQFDRWRAVNAAVQAATTVEPSSADEVALGYLGHDRQSELAVLILGLNGQGNGRIPKWFGLGSRPATIQPSELYLFNE